MKESIPNWFKIPHLDPYDGTTDLMEYLESYKALMIIQGTTDTLLCLAFPAILRKAT